MHHEDLICPVNSAIELVGDRWSLLILRDMIFLHKFRFADFAASKERIASNILTNRLRQMEAEGLIESHRDPSDRRQKIYHATDRGLGFAAAILELGAWGVTNDQGDTDHPGIVYRFLDDRDATLDEVRTAYINAKNGEPCPFV